MFKVQVIGNLGADAEVKDFQGNRFVSFKVAHTESRTKDDGTKVESTVWIGCTINGDGGKLLQYLKKGVKVFVSGSASLRVYSSKKVRAMVAGCDVRVDSVELCGGSSDAVPRQLATEDGALHDVSKLYWCQDAGVRNTFLFSTASEQFKVDENGFIFPTNQAVNDSNSEQSTEDSGQRAV